MCCAAITSGGASGAFETAGSGVSTGDGTISRPIGVAAVDGGAASVLTDALGTGAGGGGESQPA
ncbi:MAG: hypothetical protein IPK82_16790 [Polyangiaceae bacterium]|nr:hypothetical protein [Polyangiaceae bacterium]